MAGAILSGIGAVGSIFGGFGQEREEKRRRQALEQEQNRQMAIRSDISRRLLPGIEADLSGQEDIASRGARLREEGLQRGILGREAEAQRQALIDEIARVGGGTGRRATDITAPAAQARLGRLDAGVQRGLSEFGIRSAASEAARRDAARSAAQNRLLQLGQFQTGGFIAPEPSTAFEGLQQGGGALFTLGIEDILRRRRQSVSDVPVGAKTDGGSINSQGFFVPSGEVFFDPASGVMRRRP